MRKYGVGGLKKRAFLQEVGGKEKSKKMPHETDENIRKIVRKMPKKILGKQEEIARKNIRKISKKKRWECWGFGGEIVRRG